jgi:hypothetical protein
MDGLLSPWGTNIVKNSLYPIRPFLCTSTASNLQTEHGASGRCTDYITTSRAPRARHAAWTDFGLLHAACRTVMSSRNTTAVAKM